MATFIYEVVWIRPLSIVFGSTVYATSTMLTAFMAGFALGSYLFRHRADKTKNPLRLFYMLEFGIGLYGLMIIPLFAYLPFLYLSFYKISPFLFKLLQFALAFSILIIPTTLMGATWPVVNKAYTYEIERLGKRVGSLFSVNSLGNVLGSLAAGFFLIPILGVRGTLLFSASLNLLVAFSMLIYTKYGEISR